MSAKSKSDPFYYHPAIIEIRGNVREVCRVDAEFAGLWERPLSEEDPPDDLLDRMDAGDFRG